MLLERILRWRPDPANSAGGLLGVWHGMPMTALQYATGEQLSGESVHALFELRVFEANTHKTWYCTQCHDAISVRAILFCKSRYLPSELIWP